MKLDIVTKDRDIQSNLSEGYDYGIDTSQMKLLYQILSQYSNPIGSIVREITTNAFDSHLEAGINKEVTVRLIDSDSLTSTQQAFEVEDYGVGLSPERVRTIYSKFLASTKRDSNTEHGAFGLGSKSPFSYTDMFTVTTVYDGIEYGYAMHKGTETPRIDKIYEEETDKENGTVININVKPGDRERFRTEIKRQLAYFENINHINTGVDNNYTIYEGKNFLFRPDLTNYNLNSLHVCLGKVYYPLNIDMLDLDTPKIDIKCPIALRFKIGELPIVWNRENIEYTDGAIETIRTRFYAAVEELKELYEAKQDAVDSVTKYFYMKNTMRKSNLTIADGVTIPNIDHLFEVDINYPKYAELKKIPKMETAINVMYKFHRKVMGGVAKKDNYMNINSLSFNSSNAEHPITFTNTYLLSGAYSTTKNKYLYESHNRHKFYLVRKRTQTDKLSHSKIFSLFGYNANDASELDDNLVKLMREFLLECKEYFLQRVEDYDSIEVPQAFKDARKGGAKTDMFDPASDEYDPSLKVHVKELVVQNGHRRFADIKFSVWEPTIGMLERYSSSLTIYGFSADAEVLEATGLFIARMYHNRWNWDTPEHKKLNILKIAKNKEDAITTIMDNAIHVNEFYNKKHKLLVNGLTRFYIMTELESQTDTPLKNTQFTQTVDILKTLGKPEFLGHYLSVYQNVRFIEACDVPAQSGKDAYLSSLPKPLRPLFENPLYLNKTLIDEYKELQLYFKKYPLLYQIFTDTRLSTKFREVIKEEMQFYLEGKTPINPILEERLQEYKTKKQEQQKP